MGKATWEPTDSPWKRAKEAMDYFQIRREQLNILAEKAGAKKKLATRCVLYDISKIEEYLRSQL